ncbi:MAG TPA: FtsQ-type POTRA domain-containing protein [Nitriliruptoraceae bacterium]|nr:FtsQ-type POTRA domain-containing protein [Nitriliruptoraceae bacterium]
MSKVVDDRIVERRQLVRRERRRDRLHRTIAVLVVLAIAVGLLLAERSPLVAISDVEVVGVSEVDADSVIAASGIRPGTSLLRVDLDEAAASVAELPRIESAQVVRTDPLTVEISVVERQPAYVARVDDDTITIDDDGIVLSPGAPAGLVVIEVENGALPEPGESVNAVPALANALAVVEGMPGPLGPRIAGMRAIEEDRAVIVLDDGTAVEMGRAQQLDAKARALAIVLEDLDGRVVQVIDVRAPAAPVVTG